MPIKTQSAADLRARFPAPQGNAKPPDLRARDAATPSKLERDFARRWQFMFPDLEFETEYRFHKIRKFRFDFCWPEAKVAVEMAGGIWAREKSGHSSGRGLERDYEKLNLAQSAECGWIVFQLSEAMARDAAQLEQIAATVRARMEEK